MKKLFSEEIGKLDLQPFVHEAPPPFDYERIRQQIHHRVSAPQEPKRNRFRLRPWIVAAAVLILCSIGTVAAATGIWQAVFSDRVEIRSDSFPTETVPVTVQEGDICMQCDGIVGDDTTLLGAFTITRTDGTPFAEDPQGLIFPRFEEDECRQTIRISTSKTSKTYRVCADSSLQYELTDSRTLSVFLYLHDNDLNNRRIMLSEKSIYAYRPVKVIWQPDSSQVENSFGERQKPPETELQSIKEKYIPVLKPDEVLRWDDKQEALCIYERYEIVLNFKAELTPEYTWSRKELIDEPKNMTFHDNTYLLTELTAGGCSVRLSAELEDPGAFVPLMEEDIQLQLKNGRTVTAHFISGGNSSAGSFTGLYLLYDKKEGFCFTPAAPEDIQAVYLGELQIV